MAKKKEEADENALSRFLIKPNMKIVLFLGIQIPNHHIPKNLDARG